MKAPGTKGMGETWATKLDRSIAQAEAITRRHSTGDCENVEGQMQCYKAGLQLIRVLRTVKGRSVKPS